MKVKMSALYAITPSTNHSSDNGNRKNYDMGFSSRLPHEGVGKLFFRQQLKD
jgi:hypothetical protein